MFSSPLKRKISSPDRTKNTSSFRTMELSNVFLNGTELVKCFMDQIKLLKELESTKISLAMQTDFNLATAFRMYDKDGKTYCTPLDLEKGFALFSLFPSRSMIQRIIHLLNSSLSNNLHFSDFTYLFLSIAPDYSRLLRNRSYNSSKPFSSVTLDLIKDVLHIYIELHKCIGNFIRSIDRDLTVIKKGFIYMDSSSIGYLGINEIRSFISEYNYFLPPGDLHLLIAYYDIDRDGRLSLNDFSSVLADD